MLRIMVTLFVSMGLFAGVKGVKLRMDRRGACAEAPVHVAYKDSGGLS